MFFGSEQVPNPREQSTSSNTLAFHAMVHENARGGEHNTREDKPAIAAIPIDQN
jgi:hypothetical protein